MFNIEWHSWRISKLLCGCFATPHVKSQLENPQQNTLKLFFDADWQSIYHNPERTREEVRDWKAEWEGNVRYQVVIPCHAVAPKSPLSLRSPDGPLSLLAQGNTYILLMCFKCREAEEAQIGWGGSPRGAQPPPIALSVCSEHRKDFWPGGWVAALFSCNVNSQCRPTGLVQEVLKHAGLILSTVTGGVNKLKVLF